MNAILDQISRIRIIPVVVIDNADHAKPLADALEHGGLPVMEITFRTDAAKAALTTIARSNPSILLGAGTVLSVDQVKTAVDCGAKYIVSPGLNRAVVEHCLQQNITVVPGVITPTEIGAAMELGLEVVKFFPAEPSGGLSYLKAVSAPFGRMNFIPTGGIDASNLLSYLRFPKVVACGGSWMVPSDLLAAKRFDDIRSLSEQAVALSRSVSVETK